MHDELTDEQLKLVDRLLDLAIDEDVGPGDATTLALFPEPGLVQGDFAARQDGVMAGGPVVKRVFARLAARFRSDENAVRMDILKRDGEAFAKGDKLLRISGDALVVLMGERVALNILQRMCAVAGRTREYVRLVEGVAGSRAGIYDTRKTNPGHRVLDKLAVRAGGGRNHRMGLYDMILVKDNHLAKFGGPAQAVRAARENSKLPVMVEVDTLAQFGETLPAEPDYILLDNFDAGMMRRAVELADSVCAAQKLRRPGLEASGGINLSTVAAAAASGVDRISVGALTHGAGGVDIGLDFL
jgi:nicotinate-nucleotide pyrophosphorylase (carboxylating)